MAIDKLHCVLKEKRLTPEFQGVFGIEVAESFMHPEIVSLESEGLGVYKKGSISFFLECLSGLPEFPKPEDVFLYTGKDGVLM
ncbi:MAG: hypothetical protein E6R03_10845 [Hyphomicrobiaceae bacterium]|nr:MAG: hypothetical protein E6R03_10845 [Hyphomicrobiaceae bacterium]